MIEIPEMVPSAEERREGVWKLARLRSLGKGIDEHELRRAVVEGFNAAYRDGFNAAASKRCTTCRHWKLGTVTLFGPEFREWRGHGFIPSSMQGLGEWEPADEHRPDVGFCNKLEYQNEADEGALASAFGYDVDHPFYCRGEFGCVLHEPATDPSDRVLEHRMGFP